MSHEPYKGYPGDEIRVLIKRGSTVSAIADQLEKEGVVRSARLFRLYAHLNGSTLDLKAGEYQFDTPLSLVEVLEILGSGRVFYHSVTVPEGLEIQQIAEIFLRAGFGTGQDLLAAMMDPAPIADLDPYAEDLEGYLLPETYFLTVDMTEAEIVGLMLRNFREFWTEGQAARARELELTVREVVTLASLIEKETARSEERVLVSAVFHNRLRLGMKLACDPTVIYAVKRVKEYDGVINQSDLALDSPYNTYLYPGLPPGPIANPGKLSLEAALNPADSDFLYFVSRNDGSHVFSRRYSDHARAVQQYQR
jgi:UPF0755 protein